jgi:mannose-binding lectin 2
MDTHKDMEKSSYRKETNASQPYLDSDMQSRWWDFGGDTIIRTDKYVRLASDKPSRDGWIFSRVPLTATNWAVRNNYVEMHTRSSRE